MPTHSKPRTVVTGGAGFLGSHLCERFLAEGHAVTCIDNLLTGNPDNIAHLLGNPRFTFVRYDVTEYLYIAGDVDYILHFASPASPIDYLKFPIHTLKVGALGTHKALGLAKAKRARFLLASTSEVYGDPQIHPQPETYWGHVNPVGPRGVYDEAKRFAEALTMAYHRSHGVDTRIIRIFNTYGERMRLDDGRAIPAFATQALRGEDVTVFGDGSQTRSVCYVSDMMEGIFRLLMSDVTDPVNIGNPDEVSMRDLAAEIVALAREFTPPETRGRESRIVFEQLPQDDPKVRQPDISRAANLLGWEPKISRAVGLRHAMTYFAGKVRALHAA